MQRDGISFHQDVSPLLKLAIPLVLTGISQSMLFFVKAIFLAQLGPQTLAASGLVSWMFATIIVVLFGTLSSINILVAHKQGAKDQEGIGLVARDGLVLTALLTIPAILLLWNMSSIFLLFGQPKSVVLLAQSYLHALSWGIFPDFIAMAFLEVIIGIGHARFILIFSVISVALNIFLSYTLILGKLGFPALGIAGAGWSITFTAWAMLIFLFIFILLKSDYRFYFRNIFSLKKPKFLGELLRLGLPTGLMYCVEVAFFFALTLAVGTLGTQAQAANQIALQYMCVMIDPIFSLAQAITVRMGHLLGGHDFSSAKKASYIGAGIALFCMLLSGLAYIFIPETLISLDFDVHNPANFELVQEAKNILIAAALFQIFEATRVALFGALRGVKDTRYTMLVSILSFWFIALPIGFLLGIYFEAGAQGFWWGMVFGALISVILLYQRFQLKIKPYLALN